jgi:hypothetical protein
MRFARLADVDFQDFARDAHALATPTNVVRLLGRFRAKPMVYAGRQEGQTEALGDRRKTVQERGGIWAA